jgi:hypothetical protein
MSLLCVFGEQFLINPLQSNFSVSHIRTPQLLFVLGGKEVGGLLVIILQF